MFLLSNYGIIYPMRKTFKYRLYPTKQQKTVLNKTLESCRFLYNEFLEERQQIYNTYKFSLNYYDQQNHIPTLKKEFPELNLVHSQVLLDVARRVDRAYQAFFRRVKNGEKPGYPRFRGKDRYDSFTYPQSGFSLVGNVLRLSRIGRVPIIVHRPLEGKIKTCTIKRNSCGEWYACFSCDNVTPKTLPSSPLSVGIDMGLTDFLATSEGDVIKNPKYGKRSAKRLAQAQRKLAAQKKGTKEREAKKKIVSKIYKKVVNQRTDFFYKTANTLVGEYGFIFAEDLKPSEMLSYRAVNRTLYDTAWTEFLSILSCKAAEAGREFRKVDPAPTSQDCSSCGHRQKMPLSVRIYKCPACGLELPRDVNAGRTIKRLGLKSLETKIS